VTEGVRHAAWLTYRPTRRPVRLRLFCFPHAGGGASAYHAWPAGLPPWLELCAAQLPGRENRWREAPARTLGQLVDELAEALRPFLDVPFAFFGHSMGALIGFELARRLRREHGRDPVHLVVSGRQAPHLPSRRPPLHDLPEAELMERLRVLGGTPDELWEHADLKQLLLPVLRADLAVCEAYRYRPEEPLECPITACGGADDVEVSPEEVLEWSVHTAGGFNARFFAGGHFFWQDDHAALLDLTLQAVLPHLEQDHDS
jgi:medium-chain acyl-[acyl-carrier-protein] hydrolase